MMRKISGLLHRHKTIGKCGHPRKDNPVTSLEKYRRPPAEQSCSFNYSLMNERELMFVFVKRPFILFMAKRSQVL